jgi:hypothetical protein
MANVDDVIRWTVIYVPVHRYLPPRRNRYIILTLYITSRSASTTAPSLDDVTTTSQQPWPSVTAVVNVGAL